MEEELIPENEDLGEETVEEKKAPRRLCSLCARTFFEEEPAVLAVGGFGNHRYLCAECSEMFDLALESTDPETVGKAVEAIGETLANTNSDDELTLETVNGLLEKAANRKKQLEAGTLEEEAPDEEEGFEEVPEELRETEEDRKADEKEQEADEKFNRVWNYVLAGAGLAIVIFAVLKFFVLK